MKRYLTALFWIKLSIGSVAMAGQADVMDVKVHKTSKNTYTFSVTVLHEDTGWKHYATRWEILDADGSLLATRVLHHPHVNEQPFSRSLSGVYISNTIKQITVRAHDSIHKFGGQTFSVNLP